MELTLGRLGAAVTLNRPGSIRSEMRDSQRRIVLDGHIHLPSDLTAARALRDAFVDQAALRPLVAVTLDADASLAGFAVLWSASTVTTHELASLQAGRFPFTADLLWLGTDAAVAFQSLLTGKTISNDHSYAGPGSGLVGPSAGFTSVTPAPSSTVTRAGSDGSISALLGVSVSDHPKWEISPSAFYTGACEIEAASNLLTGLSSPQSPTDWQIGNSLVRVTPGSNGAIDVEHYDGTAWRSTEWAVQYAGAAVGDWSAGPSIIRNTPERCVIQLTQARAAGNVGRLVLELGVRRGSRIVDGKLTSDDTGANFKLRSDETGTITGPPTGAMIRSGVDGDGHKWMIGSEKTTTINVGVGSVAKISPMPFMISKEIDEGAGVQTGDDDSALWDQHMETRSETVRWVRL